MSTRKTSVQLTQYFRSIHIFIDQLSMRRQKRLMQQPLIAILLLFQGLFVTLSQPVLAEVFFSEGFESGNGTSFSQSSYGSVNGNPQYFIQNAVVPSGQYALQHHFNQGQGGSFATHQFGDSPDLSNPQNNHYFNIYIQFKIRYSDGYDFSAGNNKIMIIGTQDSRRHDTICCNPWVANYITLYANATGSDAFFNVEGNNKRAPSGQWFGLSPNLLGPAQPNIERSKWYTLEVHIGTNTDGASNGIFEMWIDGVQVANRGNVVYRIPWDGSVGTDPTYGINFVMLSQYINSGAPRAQDIFYDDIILSTTYIGTRGSDTVPPAIPTGLRLQP